MKYAFYVLGLFFLGSVAFADEPTVTVVNHIHIWNETQVEECDDNCHKDLTLTLPTKDVAVNLAEEAIRICEALITRNLIDRRKVPMLADIQTSLYNAQKVAQKHKDFSLKTVKAFAEVVTEMKRGEDVIESLLFSSHEALNLGRKLARLQYEFEQRCSE